MSTCCLCFICVLCACCWLVFLSGSWWLLHNLLVCLLLICSYVSCLAAVVFFTSSCMPAVGFSTCSCLPAVGSFLSDMSACSWFVHMFHVCLVFIVFMFLLSLCFWSVTHVLCACCWLFIQILPGSCWCFKCFLCACCWCVHTFPVSLLLFVSCVSCLHAVAFSFVPCWPAVASILFQVHLLFMFLICHDCLLLSFCLLPILHPVVVSCLSFESAVWCFMLLLSGCCCVCILVLSACCWCLHISFRFACCLCFPNLFMSAWCWFVHIIDFCMLFSASYFSCMCCPCLLHFVCIFMMSVCSCVFHMCPAGLLLISHTCSCPPDFCFSYLSWWPAADWSHDVYVAACDCCICAMAACLSALSYLSCLAAVYVSSVHLCTLLISSCASCLPALAVSYACPFCLLLMSSSVSCLPAALVVSVCVCVSVCLCVPPQLRFARACGARVRSVLLGAGLLRGLRFCLRVVALTCVSFKRPRILGRQRFLGRDCPPSYVNVS